MAHVHDHLQRSIRGGQHGHALLDYTAVRDTPVGDHNDRRIQVAHASTDGLRYVRPLLDVRRHQSPSAVGIHPVSEPGWLNCLTRPSSWRCTRKPYQRN